jgi:uncharacterized protein YbjT (DUF2867 family)
MYAITGITGQVGGAVAHKLLAAGKTVRAVVRDAAKGASWVGRGCELARAEMNDVAAMTAAFRGTEGVFILMPSNFDPSPGFTETQAIVDDLYEALAAARPGKVVCISTIGAQATEFNLLNQLGMLETSLRRLAMPVTFLRPAWFMENAAWDIAPAKADGIVPSYLQPLDKPVPMIATADIGRLAADLLQQDWTGHRVVELEGPARISPNDIAAAMTRVLKRDVRMEVVPRDTWESGFRAQGMRHPEPRMRMLDGFNEGWIEFEQPGTVLKGSTTIDTVLTDLVARVAKPVS